MKSLTLVLSLFLMIATANAEEAPAKIEHAEHQSHEHKHKKGCEHKSKKHGKHMDYDHDGHKHKEHNGHFDECAEETMPAAKTDKST